MIGRAVNCLSSIETVVALLALSAIAADAAVSFVDGSSGSAMMKMLTLSPVPLDGYATTRSGRSRKAVVCLTMSRGFIEQPSFARLGRPWEW